MSDKTNLNFHLYDDDQYHVCEDCGEEADELWDGVEWLCTGCFMQRQDDEDSGEGIL